MYFYGPRAKEFDKTFLDMHDCKNMGLDLLKLVY